MKKSILLTKQRNGVFAPPFGGLRGNVRASSIPHWIWKALAHDGLTSCKITEHFS